jgi:hypothetical protein
MEKKGTPAGEDEPIAVSRRLNARRQEVWGASADKLRSRRHGHASAVRSSGAAFSGEQRNVVAESPQIRAKTRQGAQSTQK